MGAAENLRLGVMGQELNLSGTAKELLKQRDELLENQPHGASAAREVDQIDKSIHQLSNPMADLVGVTLLRNASRSLTLAELTLGVLESIGAQPGETRPEAAFVLSKNVEKILSELAGLGFVTSSKRGEYKLTKKGREFFQRVLERRENFLKQFTDAESNLPKAKIPGPEPLV